MKQRGHDRAHQVARDHDVLAVEAVQDHARPAGPTSIAGMARASMTPLTTRPECVVADRQAEDRDVVEVVADFADDLADPRVPVVAVVAQQPRRRRSCRGAVRVSSRTVMLWM